MTDAERSLLLYVASAQLARVDPNGEVAASLRLVMEAVMAESRGGGAASPEYTLQ